MLSQHGSVQFSGEKTTQVTFRMFRLIVRFSKYDFGIPGQILDFKKFVSIFFLKSKKILKKFEILKSGEFLEFKGFSMGFLSK